MLETGTVKNELSRKLTRPSLRFQKTSSYETLDHWTKPQEGLSEDPLTNPEEIWYTDRNSFVLGGKRAGYVVVSNVETTEANLCHQVLQPN